MDAPDSPGEQSHSSGLFKLRDGVDVYRRSLSGDIDEITFYKINSREQTKINGNKYISSILSLLDGSLTIDEILEDLNITVPTDDINDLINFLVSRGLAINTKSITHSLTHQELNRYDRQINFLDNWNSEKPGVESQSLIKTSHVAIVGIGAIGGTIAVQLARAGISTLTLIDFKKITKTSKARHIYFDEEYINHPKTDALENYLKSINPSISLKKINKAIKPDTKLDPMLSEADLVVNTADEPYIGYTSIKLGRYLWGHKIPLYVAGGFDAHLTSTGEFIIPGQTPCIDCCSKTFSIALKDWKPKYSQMESEREIEGESCFSKTKESPVPGLSSRALFSASYGAMEILGLLSGSDHWKQNISCRGELIPDLGEMTQFRLHHQPDCEICSE